MWCLMAAPLIVATDIRNLTDIMKEVCDIHDTKINRREIELPKHYLTISSI